MLTMVLSGVFLALAVNFARDEYLINLELRKKLEEKEKEKEIKESERQVNE